MAGSNNPVALPFLLTVVSLLAAGYSWDNAPHKIPLWWTAHGHPNLWVPKWFGLLLFPVLGLLIPYIMYQVACRDELLDGQSGGSAYAVAKIIALPSLLIFVEYMMVYLEAAQSSTHNFSSRVFTSNIAIWALFWLGYNVQYVAPNRSIGVPVFSKEADMWPTIHQRSGWGLMLAGVVLFIFAQACPVGVTFLVLTLVIWLGAYAIVILYSYYVSRMTLIDHTPQREGDTPQREGGEDLEQPLVSSEA